MDIGGGFKEDIEKWQMFTIIILTLNTLVILTVTFLYICEVWTLRKKLKKLNLYISNQCMRYFFLSAIFLFCIFKASMSVLTHYKPIYNIEVFGMYLNVFLTVIYYFTEMAVIIMLIFLSDSKIAYKSQSILEQSLSGRSSVVKTDPSVPMNEIENSIKRNDMMSTIIS